MTQEWDPDAALESLKMEDDIHTTETNAVTAKRLLEENVPGAVLAIVHLSQNSHNERIRLDAAKYVTDRVLGKISDVNAAGVEDPFASIAEWLTSSEQTPAAAGSATTEG